MKRFTGDVVVVTGAGSGIGRASAEAYAAEGARVHLVDVVAERVVAAAEAIRAGGGLASAHVVDCTDGAALRELAARVVAEDGRVNVLQNGVGTLVAAPVQQVRGEDWRRIVDVNLWSVIHGLDAFLSHLAQAPGRRHLVNVASVAGLVGFPYTAPYSMTKFAIVGLSEALAYELADQAIGVTVVCPGMVRSRLVAEGRLQLPDPWPRVFDWAYENLAAAPERVARVILDAVAKGRVLAVPAPGLGQIWRAQRLGGPGFRRGASWLSRGLHRLGRRIVP